MATPNIVRPDQHVTCRGCGWQLPRVVIAMPHATARNLMARADMTEAMVQALHTPGMTIALLCPVCGNGHLFGDHFGGES